MLNDVWVLSLPSFSWTKLDSALGFIPKIDTPCALVGKKYMFALATAPEGVYSTLCSDKMDYQLLDLTTGKWVREFKAGEVYKVPDALYSIIGGDQEGNATLIEPENGFVNAAMVELFGDEQGLGTNSTAIEKSGSGTGKSIGAGPIAGIVVGAIALLALIGLVLWLMRRRKTRKDAIVQEVDNNVVSELYGKHTAIPVEADGTASARLLSSYGAHATNQSHPPTELPVGERTIAELGTDGASNGQWQDVKHPVNRGN